MKKFLSITLGLTFVFTMVFGSLAIAAPKAAKKTYVDGSYKATYDAFDSHGWKPQISLTIKADKITAVKFNYVNPAGKLKTQDISYNATMKKVNKTYPALYSPQLEQELVVAQNPTKVDTITGATSSSNNFRALAQEALANAKKGIKTTAVLFMNDTYTVAQPSFDSRGWKAQVSLTYKNGKLTAVVFDYLNKDGKKKSDDTAYNTSMKAKTGVSSKEATEKLAANYLATQATDVVTGATDSSNIFKDLVAKATALR